MGRAAREARIRADLSLLDIAVTAGVSQPTLTRFERGRGWRRDMNEIVAAYAEACGTTPEDLWRAALDLDVGGDA